MFRSLPRFSQKHLSIQMKSGQIVEMKRSWRKGRCNYRQVKANYTFDESRNHPKTHMSSKRKGRYNYAVLSCLFTRCHNNGQVGAQCAFPTLIIQPWRWHSLMICQFLFLSLKWRSPVDLHDYRSRMPQVKGGGNWSVNPRLPLPTDIGVRSDYSAVKLTNNKLDNDLTVSLDNIEAARIKQVADGLSERRMEREERRQRRAERADELPPRDYRAEGFLQKREEVMEKQREIAETEQRDLQERIRKFYKSLDDFIGRGSEEPAANARWRKLSTIVWSRRRFLMTFSIGRCSWILSGFQTARDPVTKPLVLVLLLWWRELCFEALGLEWNQVRNFQGMGFSMTFLHLFFFFFQLSWLSQSKRFFRILCFNCF